MNTEEQSILQKNLSQFLIKDVFNTIESDDILRDWNYKGKQLTDIQIANLKSQAKTFYDSMLWKILKSELIWQGQQQGFVKSQTEADQIAGKLLIFLTNEIDKKLQSIIKN
jgi:hypothetical protein